MDWTNIVNSFLRVFKSLAPLMRKSADKVDDAVAEKEEPQPKESKSGFRLSARSLRELRRPVDARLVRVVKRAIQITEQDFAVHDGMRTTAEQKRYFRKGASKIDGVKRKSNHQIGRAVDLVPVINGKLRWEWDAIYPICLAMQQAAKEERVSLRWGGVWDMWLTDVGSNPKGAVRAYSQRRRAKGKTAFLDGPHYELPRDGWKPINRH